ncbi:hypothetical protein CKO51_20540 [Rhodopirellula sp. SM50]|nr:hypothetical protein CKO51_20540 [Rhodopirellula sp. SM50]
MVHSLHGNNLLVGAPLRIDSESRVVRNGNVAGDSVDEMKAGVGQSFLSPSAISQAVELPSKLEANRRRAAADRLKPGIQRSQVFAAMRQVHAGFDGQPGYVAQFGDSIT